MNSRKICDLESTFKNAFAFELADALDEHVSDYTFEWKLWNGCFVIYGYRHRKVIDVMVYCGQCLIYCKNRSKYDRTYELANPQNTIEKIALDIANILNNWRSNE